MANTKPIIDIQVNDEAFRRFADLFNDYSAKLDDMPEAWQRLNEAMDGAGEGGQALTSSALSAKEALALAGAQAALIVEGLHKAVKAQDSLGDSTHATNKHMGTLAKTAKSLGGEIAGIGKWIIKLGAMGLAGLGVGGILSGFGIADLASSALNRQRSANQLGLTPGQLSSFQINAQQFLGVSALQAAADVQADITKAGPLATLGIDFNAARSMSSANLAFEELKKARALYLAAQAHGITPKQVPGLSDANLGALGLSFSDVRNAAMAPLADINAAQRATEQDVGPLGFDRQTAAQWIVLKKALDTAGLTIETGLIKALAPLAPQIATLSKEVVGFISAFINSKDFAAIVDDVKNGLKGLGDFLEHDVNWTQVGADVNAFGSALQTVLGYLGITNPKPGSSGPAPSPDDALSKRIQGATPWLNPLRDFVKRASGFENGLYTGPDLGSAWNAVNHGLASAGSSAAGAWKWLNSPISGPAGAAVLSVAKEQQVNPLLALATAINESGLNPKAVGDQGSSFGVFQLHRGGELGNLSKAQAFDAATNARVALAEIAKVAKAHPNLSPGQIAALAQRPADPVGYAKAVDLIYDELVEQARRATAASPPAHPAAAKPRAPAPKRKPEVKVVVYNSTSARVAVSANAVAVS